MCSVMVVEVKDCIWLIINLIVLLFYIIWVEGNNFFVVVGNLLIGVSVVFIVLVKVSLVLVSYVQLIKFKLYVLVGCVICNIDFQCGEKGEGNVVIDLFDLILSLDIQEQGGKICLDFVKIQLLDVLWVCLDVKDFVMLVQFVNVSV